MAKRLPSLFLLVALTLLCCSAARTTAFLPEQGPLFEQALAAVGLSPDDVRISDADLGLWGGEKYRLSLHEFLYDNPWKTSAYTRSLTNGLLKTITPEESKPLAPNLAALLTSAHQKLDSGVRIGLTGDALVAEKARIEELGDNALAVALSELTDIPPEYYSGMPLESAKPSPADDPAASGGPAARLAEAGGQEVRDQYMQLSPAVREAAALILFAVPRALRYRDEGLTKPILKLGLDPQAVYGRVWKYAINTFEEEDGMTGNEEYDDLDDVLLLESLMDNVDWNLLNTGATLLAVAVQEAYGILAAEGVDLQTEVKTFAVRTPLGLLSLGNSSSHTYQIDDYLLIIDTGSRDVYMQAAGTRDYAHPASMCIDLEGVDSYHNRREDLPSFGAGVFGYGILLDAAGADTYDVAYSGEGAGIFGTGLLCDMAGDDAYWSFGNSQGSGSYGAGLLVDVQGRDTYLTYKYSQGYGFTRGCGMLIDGDGSDEYQANMKDHFNGGLYGPDHHVHFCQGSAFGRRGDFTDGHSWAGGFGLLLDGGEGSDRYFGDCYVQGNSYWYAIGMLVDKGGDDTYRCAQYSQGSAPHFSAGILQDEAGNDHYTVTRRQSMGHGRDWSLAWFEDVAGNDWYQGARTTLGTSHVNAISVFWDRSGDDVYLAKGPSFGESELDLNGSARDWLLTLGLFVDGGGTDQYYELTGDPSYEGSDVYPGDVTDLTGLVPLDFAGDGLLWVKTQPGPDSPGYSGAGIDAP